MQPNEGIRFGRLGDCAVHLCIDMQMLFAAPTEWHVPRMTLEPALPNLLRERRVETVVVSGGETDVCVLATVLGAVDRGLRVVLAADALCSTSDRAHDCLLTLYREPFSQQIEAASIEDILAYWG
jgi:nicotinamidase-related amidase